MSPVLQFLLVLLLAVLAGSKVTVQGFMSRKHIRTAQDNLWFNSLLFFVIAVLMALIFSIGEITGTIIFFAVLAGLCNIGFQYCYAIALRTGPSMRECDRLLETIRHFYGHLEVDTRGTLGLCQVENRDDALGRREEILRFCEDIVSREKQ